MTTGPVLWLLRHGKAADPVGFPGGDAARPLTPKGEAQAAASGRALSEHAPALAAILTSPRVRAHRTAELAAEAFGAAPRPEVFDELGGDYGLGDLLALVSPWTDGTVSGRGGALANAAGAATGSTHVLVVGHNPTLSILAHELTGAERGLSTGALIGIDLARREAVARVVPQV